MVPGKPGRAGAGGKSIKQTTREMLWDKPALSKLLGSELDYRDIKNDRNLRRAVKPGEWASDLNRLAKAKNADINFS